MEEGRDQTERGEGTEQRKRGKGRDQREREREVEAGGFCSCNILFKERTYLENLTLLNAQNK